MSGLALLLWYQKTQNPVFQSLSSTFWNSRLIIRALEFSQEYVWRREIKEISRGRVRSSSWHYPAICAGDFQIVQCWLINQALVFSFIFIRGGQIATASMSGQGKARRRSRLFGCCRRWIRGLLCAGWMSVFAVCLHCLYGPRLPDSIHRDSQGARLGPGNDRDYAKCPPASVSLAVMDLVCNRLKMWPHCYRLLTNISSWVSIVKSLKLDTHFFAICLYMNSLLWVCITYRI